MRKSTASRHAFWSSYASDLVRSSAGRRGEMTMAIQGIEALDVLQARVAKMLDILSDLREKRDSLQNRVDTLESEGVAKDNELAQLREDNARLLKIQEE